MSKGTYLVARPATQRPASPAIDDGNHADIVIAIVGAAVAHPGASLLVFLVSRSEMVTRGTMTCLDTFLVYSLAPAARGMLG